MIPTKTKYKWTQTADGRYNIFDVDIFKTKRSEQIIVSAGDEAVILKNFENDKNNDWLPRVHLGHQNYNETKNCQGIGYLDKLYFEKDSNTFFANLIDIPVDIFEQIMQRKFPYRSVEFDTAAKKIVGLALLESRPPFFTFPVLDLAQFYNKTTILLFSEEKEIMELENKDLKEKKNTKKEEQKKEDLSQNVNTPLLSLEEVQQLRGFLSVSDKLLGLAQIADKLAMSSIKIEKSEAPKQEEEKDTSAAGIPEVLACELDKMKKRIEQFEKNHADVNVYARLKAVSDKDSNIDFDKEKMFIEKFESHNDKLRYIEKLEAKQGDYEEHFISQFASNFSGKTSDLKEYETLTGKKRETYLKAKKDYMDTINNKKTMKQFSSLFPTMKEYIDYSLVQFEISGEYRPDYV